MTVLGKTLVIVNLVFSVIVGALIIMVYSTRTNWSAEYKKLKDRYDVAVASRDNSAESARAAAMERDARLTEVRNEYAKQVRDRDAEIARLANVTQERKEFETKYQDAAKEVSTLQAEIARRKEEVAILEKASKEQQTVNGDLVKKNSEERQTRVNAEIQVRTLKDRNQGLLAKVQEQEKELRARPAGAGGSYTSNVNPPPEDVRGLVEVVDREHGLLQLTIGSDSGLQKGQTLEAFRVDPNDAGRSKYLGTIRILDVRAKSAVARPERALGQFQVGDRVASRL
jgi:hypothetical protein